MKLIWVIMIGLATNTLMPIAQAAETPEGPHLVTVGKSRIEAIPDIATIIIEVNVLVKDVTEAKKQVDARIVHYFDFLHKNGIAAKDIHAANLDTQLEYDYLKNGEKTPKGYRASRQVQIVVRQLDKINSLVEGALKLGLNEIREIKFGVSNPVAYQEKARKQAIENATAQAISLAQGFKVKLGPIYSIRYHIDSDSNMPIRLYKSVGLSSPNNTDKTYQSDTLFFTDQVDVIFKLN